MTGELERQNGEQRGEITHLKSELTHRINMQEDRQKAIVAELHNAVEGNRDHTNNLLDKMDTKFRAMMDKATSGWSDMMVYLL